MAIIKPPNVAIAIRPNNFISSLRISMYSIAMDRIKIIICYMS